MLGTLWLIPIVCLVGAVVNLLLGASGARKSAITIVGVGSVGLAAIASWVTIWQFLRPSTGEYEAIVESYFTWIRFNSLEIGFSFQLDPLSVAMLAFTTLVGFLVHLYSVGYMKTETDRGYARYFAYLNLFMFSMLMLVLGSNLLVLFIGWEGVGLCSYLLVGFYFDKEFSADAGNKAFIVNRIGDLGLLFAIFVILNVFGTLEFTELFGLLNSYGAAQQYGGAMTVIGILLFVAAIGKSAQIPLFVWHPDAMAGPSPVSALIHAATMVTTGVYLVVRCNFFFQLSPVAMLTVAIVGGTTAIFAATIALVQNDIKKVLAYSTISQLGTMFLAVGVGAYIAAIFHVIMFAFIQACLFLGAGSVIHSCSGERNLRKMGGLKKYLPKTYWTFWLAAITVAAILPVSGFVSKNAILTKVFEAGVTDLNGFGLIFYLLWVLGICGAALTGYYMFRLVYMTFEGSFRGSEETEGYIHEAGWTMTFPLQVLAFLSVIGGLALGFPGRLFHLKGTSFIHSFLGPLVLASPGNGVDEGHSLAFGLEWFLVILSVAVALRGIQLARRWYKKDPTFSEPNALAVRFPAVHKLLFNKYWVDEVYDRTLIRPVHRLAVLCWEIIDVIIIDTFIVNGSAFVTQLTGDVLRFLQTGRVRNYALSVALGILAIAVILW
ncbi:MAG: NADH-quinone oxidoreductase subunit L [Thermoanaerobaculales bacterium]|nr:NADH-quinone oxidoreductase subunit L [Thermoanaerobaculales bacterium]